jgi:hypothetical protein
MDVSQITRFLLVPALLVSLWTAPVIAEGPPLGVATPAQQKDFKKKFGQAQKLFKAGKFDEAIRAFEQAYDAVADPEARLMIARAQQNLGQLPKAHAEYVTAIAELESAVQQGDKYRDLLEAAKKEFKELEGVVAWLTIKLIHAPEGTTVTIEGEPVDAAKLGEPLLLQPGLVNVVATTPDGREASRQLTLNAGQSSKVDLAFVRDDEPIVEEGVEKEDEQPAEASASASSSGGGTRTMAYVAGGVGIAGLATFGIFGVLANNKFNKLEDNCTNDICNPKSQDDIDNGKTFQTVANVGLVVGVIGLGTSAGLFLFGGSGSSDEKREEAAVNVDMGLSSIKVRGRF